MDSNAKLPESRMPSDDEWISQSSRDLEVPNQLGPELGSSRPDLVRMAQMFPGLVTCPDGTMLDMKTGKVIVDPRRGAQPGEWAPIKVIQPPQIVQDLQNEQPSSSGCLNNSDSQKYWKDQAAAEQKKQPEMSDVQKKLLADLEAGNLMKLSRLELVDESVKTSKSIDSKSHGKEENLQNNN